MTTTELDATTTTSHPLRRRTTAAATLVLTCLVAGLFAFATAPTDSASAASTVNGRISRSEVIERARHWLTNPPPGGYNTSRQHPDRQGKTYRTDCSGYASMALHLSASFNTAQLSTPTYTTQITKADLKTGDLVIHPPAGPKGHVLIFEKWANAEHTRAWMYDFGSGSAPKYRSLPFAGAQYNDGRIYNAYRYKNIIDDSGSVFAEGAFVKSDSSATVYRIAGGAPVPVSSMTLVGNSPITTLPAATINSLLASNPFPRDNTFVKSDSSATVYRMAGGTPVPISSMNIVGTSNIVVLNEYSIGWLNNKNPFPRDNTFVKSDSSATVYRMAGGTPVPISSMNIVGTSNIVVLNEWSINWLRSNNPFPRDNTFVKSDTSATVYRITGRTLVPLTSMTQVGTNTIVVLNEYSINWLHNLAAN